MLAYVPVKFDVYRPLKPHLRWTLQCLVGFADKTGRCYPSVRKLAEVTGISKSSVSRHLAELEKAHAITRRRRPGGVYTYQIDARFLPAARMASKLSHRRERAVPRAPTEEKPFLIKKTSHALRDSQVRGVGSAFPDDLLSVSPWQQRLQSWERSRFWLPQ